MINKSNMSLQKQIRYNTLSIWSILYKKGEAQYLSWWPILIVPITVNAELSNDAHHKW